MHAVAHISFMEVMEGLITLTPVSYHFLLVKLLIYDSR